MATARRFLLALVVIRFLPFPVGRLPGTEWLGNLVELGRAAFVALVSARIFGHALEPGAPAQSGDTTFDYIALGCEAVLALTLAIAWPHAARRFPGLAPVARITRPYLRYALAATLLAQGVAKVLPIQYPEPSWAMLTQRYGESTPTQLLAMFMGSSRTYAIASGAAEMTAGALLLFAWTTGLGALLALGLTSNAVLLNFCYDMPAKIASSTYLQAAFILLAPHAGRALRALWSARPRLPAGDRSARWRMAGRALVVVAVACAGLVPVLGQRGGRQGSPWAGLYEVTCYDGATGPQRWERVEITGQGVHARFADGSHERFVFAPRDAAKGAASAERVQADGSRQPVQLEPARAEDGSVVLTLREGDAEVRACLRPTAAPAFPLTRGGFRWIDASPNDP